ncbi:MAG: Peptidase S9 prolyl oligopeptidase active site domain-containing protein [Candidatus Moranbacteria bacterium GW2011_GWE1_36_7]|nr:MAG: Peptidase S9 prolyl oligopeptidase active site domain-containing protein [Candidatus Moranbacteria bacterium GW2011_GWD2_36_12]KKQ05991.1 MAG: Peptidase S9 prolyl oligopeptidase active site domain-containing protein [Candidatus Moranbacteria bacterium GW2011_GWE2_36_40]KKQ14869.1 MAG: Peptidase S9 prolyl oligopeptidase active site domain-containing protein [Candidatus Moranbacteria bacterium GW2011_GWE1_36_7]
MKKISTAIGIVLLLSLAIFSTFYFKNKTVEKTIPIEVRNEIEKQETEPQWPALTKDSIPTMANKNFTGSDLRMVKVLDKNEYYTRYSITYKSEGFKISGIMNVPVGKGQFPVLILSHGFIDPKYYTNGQGLKREQDFFARNGYVVLHSDYRNHAESDFDPENDVRPRSGYVEDVLNAISAVKNSSFEFFDKENIGMLGHSMGGGITLNIMVTKPEIAKAYVLLAPINADYKINFDKWVVPDEDFSGIAQKFYQQYGTIEENPEFWKSISAINYLDKIKSPVMLHQGAKDEDVPVQWSRELAQNLKAAGKDITYYEYPDGPHTFINEQSIVMQRTLNFFDKLLKKK